MEGVVHGSKGVILTGRRRPFRLHPYQPFHMNPPYEKTTNGPDMEPKRPPAGDADDKVPRPKTQKPPNVDDLVIRQIQDWQMDTEVQAFMHKAEKKGGRKRN